MLFALIFACIMSLTLGLLLFRQIAITRKTQNGLHEWKHLYEQAHRARAEILKSNRARDRQGEDQFSRAATNLRGAPPRRQNVNQTVHAKTTKSSANAARPVAKPLVLVLPIQLLSKNARDKLHYQARGKLRKQYRKIIELKYPRRAPTPQVKQRATIIRIKGPRERDFDQQNIGAGSAIELIDALTAAGYWVDDSPKWLEAEFKQGSSETIKGPAVLVEIRVLA